MGGSEECTLNGVLYDYHSINFNGQVSQRILPRKMHIIHRVSSIDWCDSLSQLAWTSNSTISRRIRKTSLSICAIGLVVLKLT